MKVTRIQIYHKGLNFYRNILKLPKYLLLSIFLYAVVFSVITILRMESLQTYAYDLGNYNQAIYTTVTGNGFLYYTADLLANPFGSIFGVHISVALLEILPIYVLIPRVETILVIQSIIISLGAIPVYLLAKLKLESKKMAMIFSLLFLLNPVLQGINWYDFHPEAFIILPFLSAIYLSEIESWKLYFIAILFTFFAIDKAAMVVGAFAVFKIAQLTIRGKTKKEKTSLLKIKNHEGKTLAIYLVTFIAAITWFMITAKLVSIFNPYNLYTSGATQYWSNLGASNLIEIPLKLILNPDLALKALTFDITQKIVYILILFGPLLFLSFMKPLTLIMYIPWLATSLLSNYPPYYQTGTQYPAFILPVIFYGGIIGAKKILVWVGAHRNSVHIKKRMSKMLILITLIFFCISSPIMWWSVGAYPFNTYGLPTIPSQAQTVNEFIEMVPKNASILVQNNIFPLVSNRKTAFVTPSSVFFPSNTSFSTVLTEMLKKMDYILLDIKTGRIDAGLILSNKVIEEEYGLLGFANGVFLLKRGYTDKPLVCEEINEIYNYKNLILLDGVTIENDYQSKSQRIMCISGKNKDFWYGPYVYLSPGKYQANFRIKITEEISGEILTLRIGSFVTNINGKIWGNNQTGYHTIFSIEETKIKNEHNTMQILGEDFIPNEYKEFVIDFEVNLLEPFEFVGMKGNTTKKICLDQIEIKQIEVGYTYSSMVNLH